MNYAEMSDFEINKLVAQKFQLRNISRKSDELSGSTIQFNDYVKIPYRGHGDIEYQDRVYYADYCNNPSDAWPILLENHIAVAPYRNATPCAWPSGSGLISDLATEHKNPLRAGMIVFLKMKDAEGK